MTDVSVPVLIPYARFLEFQARRGVNVTAPEPPDGRIIPEQTASAPGTATIFKPKYAILEKK